MEIEVLKKQKVIVDRIRAECGVRYWEDATVNGECDEDGTKIPLRMGDYWCPTIILETGQIQDWPEGVTASVHYKVCDDGKYSLLSPSGDVIALFEGYVPNVMCPQDNGYGDYVIMTIGPNGVIEGWTTPDLSPWEIPAHD